MHPWAVSDEWWARVAPLVPPTPAQAQGGRPRRLDRAAFAAIVAVLWPLALWPAPHSPTARSRFPDLD
jgi:transposase